MPLVHQRIFRIRHYECDAYGHVNHANYLRYMQETALDASAAVGYDPEWYEAHKRAWIIRETDITYVRPLVYGDEVVVQTWVANFGRVRSRRAYRLVHAGSGETVAEAHTDWVYINLETERPASIPQEMLSAFAAPHNEYERNPFPKAPPAPAGTFTMRQPVTWRDLDTQQHVNNATFIAYLEECGMQVCAARGWPAARMFEAGFGIVARRYRIQYVQPARLGDELTVSTWASALRRATAVRHYLVEHATSGVTIVRANGLWVWVSLTSGKPVRIPRQFAADFADNIVF